jgi:hypothetical protein
MIIEDSAFSYGGKYYQLLKNGKKASALPKAKITVLISNKIGVKAMYSDVIYDTRELTERPKKAVNHQHKEKIGNTKPSKDHPWRKISNKKAITHAREDLFYEKEDIEIDNILKDLFNSTREWL